MSLLKVALVGCGIFGKKRAAALKRCPQAQLAFVYDVDSNKANALSTEFGAIPAQSLDIIANNSEIEAVFVAVDNQHHGAVCVPLLEKDKSVLCEKPLAHNLTDAEAIVRAAENSKGIFKLGSNLRFFAMSQKAKELISAGALGKITSTIGTIGHNGEMVKGKWNEKATAAGGGTLIDNGSHILDLFNWFFGPLAARSLVTTSSFHGDVESFARAEMTAPQGFTVTAESSWSRLSGYADFRIVGETATLTGNTDWNYLELNKINGGQEKIELIETAPSNVAEINYFLECVDRKRQAAPSAQDAFQTLKLIHSLYELAK